MLVAVLMKAVLGVAMVTAFPPDKDRHSLAIDGTLGQKDGPSTTTESDPSTATIMQQLMEIASSAGATNSEEYFKELCQVKDAMLTIVRAIDAMLGGKAFGGEPHSCKAGPAPIAPHRAQQANNNNKLAGAAPKTPTTGSHQTDHHVTTDAERATEQMSLVKKMKEVVDFIPMTDADVEALMEANAREAASKMVAAEQPVKTTASEGVTIGHQQQLQEEEHDQQQKEAQAKQQQELTKEQAEKIAQLKRMLDQAEKMQQVKQLAALLPLVANANKQPQ